MLNISEKLQILSRMYFFNSCKFSTSYVFRAFLFFFIYCVFAVKSKFFEKFVLTHQVVDFHHLPNFSSGCQLSSPPELFIRLLTFITFQSFHQVVDFHHFPKFSSTSNFVSVCHCAETFSSKKLFVDFEVTYFSRKSNRRSILKNEKENDSNKNLVLLLLTAASGVKENI